MDNGGGGQAGPRRPVLWVLAWLIGWAISFYGPLPARAAEPLPAACPVPTEAGVLALDRCGLDRPAPPGPWQRERVLVLDNPGPDPLLRWLDLGVPDVQYLQARLDGNALAEPQDSTTPFPSRPVPHPRMVLPLTLPPGISTLELHYTVHAGGRLAPVLFSPPDFLLARSGHDLVNGLILGGMLTLTVVSAAYGWVTRQRSYSLYSPLVLTEVLMLVQTEGYGFAHLWPLWPRWNGVAPLVLGGVVMALHALFAMDFLRLRQRHRLLHRLHLGLLGALALNLLWMPGLAFELVTIALSIAYCPLAFYAGLHAVRAKVPGAPLYVLGMAWLFIFGIVLFSLGIVGHNPIPAISHFHYPKIGLLVEAFCFSAALINRMRLAQTQQAEQRMRRLAETQQLLEAEQARREADARARDKALQLAGAGHDLSQPLASLRFAAEALKAQASSEPIARHLERTLAHAQSLLRSLIDDNRDELSSLSDELDLETLLPQWLADHQPVAQSRRVGLRCARTRQRIRGSELVLGRIVHNLLGNAVRHSGRGGQVLLGVRRRPGGLELQVLDTGPGLVPADIAHLQRPFTQGEGATEGHGLGLHIVRSLCMQAGYRFLVRSVPGRGSCFAVFMPQGPD